MKEEGKIKMIKINALKRAARMNQHGKLVAKIYEVTAKHPNDMMDYEYPSTPLIQVLVSLPTYTIKDSYHNLGGKTGQFPDHKKRTAAAAIMQKWGESIWVMGWDVCVL